MGESNIYQILSNVDSNWKSDMGRRASGNTIHEYIYKRLVFEKG